MVTESNEELVNFIYIHLDFFSELKSSLHKFNLLRQNDERINRNFEYLQSQISSENTLKSLPDNEKSLTEAKQKIRDFINHPENTNLIIAIRKLQSNQHLLQSWYKTIYDDISTKKAQLRDRKVRILLDKECDDYLAYLDNEIEKHFKPVLKKMTPEASQQYVSRDKINLDQLKDEYSVGGRGFVYHTKFKANQEPSKPLLEEAFPNLSIALAKSKAIKEMQDELRQPNKPTDAKINAFREKFIAKKEVLEKHNDNIGTRFLNAATNLLTIFLVPFKKERSAAFWKTQDEVKKTRIAQHLNESSIAKDQAQIDPTKVRTPTKSRGR